MVSTSQKISCPLARISSFFENCPPSHLIPIMASTIRNIALIKNTVSTRQKIHFHQPDEEFVEIFTFNLKNLKIAENIEKTGVV